MYNLYMSIGFIVTYINSPLAASSIFVGSNLFSVYYLSGFSSTARIIIETLIYINKTELRRYKLKNISRKIDLLKLALEVEITMKNSGLFLFVTSFFLFLE